MNTPVTLSSIGNGALVEKFQVELERIIRNIQDPNTTLDERTLEIKIKMKPNDDRSWARTKLEVKSKLAPDMPVETNHFFADDLPVAYEHTPHKQTLVGEVTGFNKVSAIKKAE